MHKLTMVLYMFLCCTMLFAQTEKKYSVTAGEVPDRVIPFDVRYAFPAFMEGVAELRTGAALQYKFNYNYLLDEIQFVTASGDTLAIAEPASLKKVRIDSAVYYYRKGYIRELKNKAGYILGMRRLIIQAPDKKQGGYDVYSGSSSITNYSSIISGNKAYALEVKRDALFMPSIQYFLGDEFGNFEKADKKTFLRVFEEKKNGVQEYIKENNINFNIAADIALLFEFCTR